MRNIILGLLLLASPYLFAQAAPAHQWTLPQGLAVKDSAPRTYVFTVVYNVANTRGDIMQRQRLTGEYTRGLPGGHRLPSAPRRSVNSWKASTT